MTTDYVNVVIPSFNRINEVCKTLEILSNQTLAARVIISDDGSEDNIVKLHAHYPCLWKYIWTRRDGKYHRVAWINGGLSFCDSKYIIVIDNDCIPMSVDFTLAYATLLDKYDVVRGKFMQPDGSCLLTDWFSTANIGFKKTTLDSFPYKGFDPNYDGVYGYDDADIGETVKHMGLGVGHGSDGTAVMHVGKSYDGDRSNVIVNETYFRNKWNLH